MKVKYTSYKDKYNKKYSYDKGTSHSLKEISKDTGVSLKGIQQIYNKGIGAFKTNPQSVRPSVKSAEQWAYGRVYSSVMGGKASKIDKNELKMEKGGKIYNAHILTDDNKMIHRRYPKKVTHKEIYQEYKDKGVEIKDSQIHFAKPIDFYDTLREETKKYVRENMNDDVDSKSIFISSMQKGNEYIATEIKGDTISGKAFTITPKDLFEITMKNNTKRNYAKGGEVKKFPISVQRRVDEINAMLPKVLDSGNYPSTYAGSTMESYVILEKPIEIKNQYVYINADKMRDNYPFEKRYNVNDREDNYMSSNGRQALMYDLGIIKKAFTKLLKNDSSYAKGGKTERKNYDLVVQKTKGGVWEVVNKENMTESEANEMARDYEKSGIKYHDLTVEWALPFAKGGKTHTMPDGTIMKDSDHYEKGGDINLPNEVFIDTRKTTQSKDEILEMYSNQGYTAIGGGSLLSDNFKKYNRDIDIYIVVGEIKHTSNNTMKGTIYMEKNEVAVQNFIPKNIDAKVITKIHNTDSGSTYAEGGEIKEYIIVRGTKESEKYYYQKGSNEHNYKWLSSKKGATIFTDIKEAEKSADESDGDIVSLTSYAEGGEIEKGLLSKGFNRINEVYFEFGNETIEVLVGQKGLKHIGIEYQTEDIESISREMLNHISKSYGNGFKIDLYTNAGVDLKTSENGRYKNITTHRISNTYDIDPIRQANIDYENEKSERLYNSDAWVDAQRNAEGFDNGGEVDVFSTPIEQVAPNVHVAIKKDNKVFLTKGLKGEMYEVVSVVLNEKDRKSYKFKKGTKVMVLGSVFQPINKRGKDRFNYSKGGVIYKHKYIPTMTFEITGETENGYKGIQKDKKSLSRLERTKGKSASYSSSELKDLFNKETFAKGGSMASGGKIIWNDVPFSIVDDNEVSKKMKNALNSDYFDSHITLNISLNYQINKEDYDYLRKIALENDGFGYIANGTTNGKYHNETDILFSVLNETIAKKILQDFYKRDKFANSVDYMDDATYKIFNSYSKGGKTELNEDGSNMPKPLYDLFAEMDLDRLGDYSYMEELREEANEMGYDFDYGLDGELTEFWEINKMAKGGSLEAHALEVGDEILGFDFGEAYVIKKGVVYMVDLAKGKRKITKMTREDAISTFGKGGMTNNFDSDFMDLVKG